MKTKIYCSNPRTINELKGTIIDYIQKVDIVLKDVFRNMMTRATRCTEAGGGHFQHLLKVHQVARISVTICCF